MSKNFDLSWDIYKKSFVAILIIVLGYYYSSYFFVTRQGLIFYTNWSSTGIEAYFSTVKVFLFAGGLLYVIGFMPVMSLTLLAVGLTLLCVFDAGLYPQTQLPMLFILYFLIDELVVFTKIKRDFMGRDPFKSLKIIIGAVYFNAFLNKILMGKSAWFSGKVFQEDLVLNFLMYGSDRGTIFIYHPVLSMWTMIFVLLFEMSFPVLILFEKLNVVSFSAGIFFHLMILFFLQTNFLFFYLPCYLVFLHVYLFKTMKKTFHFKSLESN